MQRRLPLISAASQFLRDGGPRLAGGNGSSAGATVSSEVATSVGINFSSFPPSAQKCQSVIPASFDLLLDHQQITKN